MKPKTTGTVSGCIVWILVFGALSLCMFPAATVIGGFTSSSRVIAALLAFALATPAGLLISRLVSRQKSNIAETIAPN
jgi:hypothetical protein